jgi:tetratricopeptide (TPR) repeat protein
MILRFLLIVVGTSLLMNHGFASAQSSGVGLPREVASTGVSVAQWNEVREEVRKQSARARVSERSLLAVAEATGVQFSSSGSFNAASLQQIVIEALEDQANQLADLQARLNLLIGDSDRTIESIFMQARAALDSGNLREADRLMSDVSRRDLVALQIEEVQVERLRLRAGNTMASRGQVAYLQADYITAAQHFERARQTAPESALSDRAAFAFLQAKSLSKRGRLFSELERLIEAASLLKEVSLPLYERLDKQEPNKGWKESFLVAKFTLGSYLSMRGELGDSSALNEAIEVLSGLDVSDSSPESKGTLAAAQNSLGNAYRARGWDDRNLALAEKLYRQALAGFPAETTTWGIVADNLAATLSSRASLAGAPIPDESIDLFRRALQIQTAECCRSRRAQTLVNLANAWSNSGEINDSISQLNLAVQHYQEALALIDPSTSPLLWKAAQKGLGLAMDVIASLGKTGAYSAAASAYGEALSVVDRDSYPKDWANLQRLRGTSLRRIETQEALSEAEHALGLALGQLNRLDDQDAWADVKYELGMTFSTQGDFGQTDRFFQSVAAFQDALTVYSSSEKPLTWARTNQNLGVAYERLANRISPRYFYAAAGAYRRALTIYTREQHPQEWALAMQSLGNALSGLGRYTGQTAALLEALSAYQAALLVYSQERSPIVWGQVWNSIGSTYRVLGDRQSLANALVAYAKSLEVHTRERYPDMWFSVQYDIGLTHVSRAEQGELKAISEAIVAFERSLQVGSRASDVESWAYAKFQLARSLWMYAEQVDPQRVNEAHAAALDAASGFREASNIEMLDEANRLLSMLKKLRRR